MEKRKVFVCRFCGKSYTVYAMPHPKIEGKEGYATYVGRRRLDMFTWDSFEGAIGSILGEHPEFNFTVFGEFWL
jgi:hypothetical protein